MPESEWAACGISPVVFKVLKIVLDELDDKFLSAGLNISEYAKIDCIDWMPSRTLLADVLNRVH